MMTTVIPKEHTTDELQHDNEALRDRLQVAEETLNAIRRGEVDSLVAQTADGPRVFSLTDAYAPFQSFVEEMQHGAATLSPRGIVLYCNHSLPILLRSSIERVVGAEWQTLVAEDSAEASRMFLVWAAHTRTSQELTLRASDGTAIPVYVSAHPLAMAGINAICLVITDLTERKRAEEESRKLSQIVEATEGTFLRKTYAALAASATELGREKIPGLGRTETTFRTRAIYISQAAAISVMAIGLLVLLGWLCNVTLLKRGFPGMPSMKPNAALALLFAGMGCLLATNLQTNPRLLLWRNAAALAAAALGTLTMFEWVFAVDLGIDQLLFQEMNPGVGTVVPGRMAPWTALNLMLLGTSLLLVDVRRARPYSISESFALLACLPSILSLCGYVFGLRKLYGVGLQAEIALHTNLAIVLLAVGILSARADKDWLKKAMKDYGIAILAVTLGFLLHWILWPILGAKIPFLLHWPAVIFAAWYGGFRAGLLATLLAAIGTVFLIFEPRWSMAIASPANQFGVIFFLFLGIGMSWLLEKLRGEERIRVFSNAESHAIRATSTYFRSLIEANLDPLVTIGANGKITDANAATETVTGLPRKELIGTDFANYFTEPDKSRQVYLTVFREGSVRDFPLEIRHRDGQVTPVLYNATAYRDELGKLIGVFAAARDISARKRAEEDLRQSESRFRSLVEASSLLVWNADPAGRIDDIPKWRDFTGQSREEIRGNGWLKSLHRDDQKRASVVWSKAVADRAFYETEYRVRRRDGEYRDFLARGVPILDDNRHIREWVGTCTDITESKRSAEEIRILNAELEQRVQQRTADLAAANKELETFSYSVSHDLRAPLRAIDGFSQVLLEDYAAQLDAEGVDSLRRVRAAVQRMGHLIDDMLKLSRLSRAEMKFEPVDLSSLGHRIITDLRKLEPDRQVDDVIADGLVAWGDAALLEAVLTNLLQNSWKFTAKHERARIEFGSTQSPAGEQVFFVHDDGAGFDMNYVDKLFAPFQRLHGTNEFAGTGIGLATVQRILRRHGGRIWAEGAVEKGATFSFTIGQRQGGPNNGSPKVLETSLLECSH